VKDQDNSVSDEQLGGIWQCHFECQDLSPYQPWVVKEIAKVEGIVAVVVMSMAYNPCKD
jgi:hypothetical protein